MPCYTPPHGYCSHEDNEANNLICELSGNELQVLRKFVNKITSMLCELCLAMESAGIVPPYDINKWYKKHKEFDIKRKEKQE